MFFSEMRPLSILAEISREDDCDYFREAFVMLMFLSPFVIKFILHSRKAFYLGPSKRDTIHLEVQTLVTDVSAYR